MRMWMVDPGLMCDRHLLGEHVECHMFTGQLKRKRNIDGYIENGLLEPASLNSRHDELAGEMIKRGFKHKSPLKNFGAGYLPKKQQKFRVDRESSYKELKKRCVRCRQMARNID